MENPNDGFEMWFCGFHEHTRQSYGEEWYAITVPDPEASPSSFNSKKLVPLSIPKVLYNKINRADYHAVLGSHLYSFGGQISNPPDSNYGYKEFDNYSTEVWALDTTHPSDHWKPCPPMTRPRLHPPATVLDGKIYVLAGFNQFFPPNEVGWMEVFDPNLGTWEALPNPPSDNHNHIDQNSMISFALLETRKEIFVTTKYPNFHNIIFYIYNVMNRSWRKLIPSMRIPEVDYDRVVGVGNTIYWVRLYGIIDRESCECVVCIQAYDLDRDVWFKGTVDTHSIYGKRERICDHNHRLHHLCDRKFCLLIRSTQNKGKGEDELKNYYLYCLILDVSTIYEDEEWQLSISIVSVQKYDTGRYFNMLDSLLM